MKWKSSPVVEAFTLLTSTSGRSEGIISFSISILSFVFWLQKHYRPSNTVSRRQGRHHLIDGVLASCSAMWFGSPAAQECSVARLHQAAQNTAGGRWEFGCFCAYLEGFWKLLLDCKKKLQRKLVLIFLDRNTNLNELCVHLLVMLIYFFYVTLLSFRETGLETRSGNPGRTCYIVQGSDVMCNLILNVEPVYLLDAIVPADAAVWPCLDLPPLDPSALRDSFFLCLLFLLTVLRINMRSSVCRSSGTERTIKHPGK